MRTFPIVGAFYRPPAPAIINALPVGAELLLIPEDSNPYDSNAIAVWCPKESLPTLSDALRSDLAGYGVSPEQYMEYTDVHLGYIPRALAADLRARGFAESAIGTFGVDPRGKPFVRMED